MCHEKSDFLRVFKEKYPSYNTRPLGTVGTVGTDIFWLGNSRSNQIGTFPHDSVVSTIRRYLHSVLLPSRRLNRSHLRWRRMAATRIWSARPQSFFCLFMAFSRICIVDTSASDMMKLDPASSHTSTSYPLSSSPWTLSV